MKDSLQTIVEALVEDKSSIQIEEITNNNGITFEVRVAQSDMGRVIGKEGRIAKAIRTILKAVGTKEQKKVTVEFID